MFEYEVCTPRIAKDFLEKFSKLQDEDVSSDEAKEVLSAKGEGGDWTEMFEGINSSKSRRSKGRPGKAKAVKDEHLRKVNRFWFEDCTMMVDQRFAGTPKCNKFVVAVRDMIKPFASMAENGRRRCGHLSLHMSRFHPGQRDPR